MADNKQATGPEEHLPPEAPMSESFGPPPAPDLTAPTPEKDGQAAPFEMGGAVPNPGDVVVSAEQIEALMAEGRAKARETVEKNEPPAPEERPPAESDAEQKKPRRGRPSKEEKATPEGDKAAKPRKGRPPKGDKAAPGEAQPQVEDKVSQSKKAAPDKGEAPASTPEQPPAPEEPAAPPRPVEDGQLVYLKLSELHPFHTFRDHPYKVTDDEKMTELVGTIKERGVMTPATVRPEKDGNGYEIIAGHRRHHGSGLAGLEEMPCIVRSMTDLEAVQEMKISNKQRGDPFPSELARLLDLEVEAIKHQGGRLDGVPAGDIGKRSVELVGENNGMNYKKVMRYIRLNFLTPELLNMVDEKKLGFMPAVELSFIKPKNQRLVAVSIDGEQSKPSVAQAKRLRELDKDGKLNGDIIDGILSEQKKEDKGVIISTAELDKYFGKEVTPAKMKEQIISLLEEMKAKQPPELAKQEKKADLEK